MSPAKPKKKGKDKDILKQLGRFYEAKVEPKMRNGFKEVEKILKKEIRFEKLDEVEKLLKKELRLNKVEKLLKKEIRIKKLEELEKLLKKEIRLGKLKDADIFKYDPESPFSYLSAFLRDKAVASVAPSTKFVVDRVLKAMALDRARLAVEFGPAEGVITRRILKRLPQTATLLVIEQNKNFAEAVGRIRDKRLRVVRGDVQDIDAILKQEKLGSPDVMVSGIPFSYFEPIQRHELLRKTSELLAPKGRFVAYQFTTHLIPLLKLYFRKVDTQFEIRNLPPHFIFTCHK